MQGDTWPWSVVGAGVGYNSFMSAGNRQRLVSLLAREGALAPLPVCEVCGDDCERHRYSVSFYRESHRTGLLFVCAEERVLVAMDSSQRVSASFAPVGDGIVSIMQETLPSDSSADRVLSAGPPAVSAEHPHVDDWFVGESPPHVTSFAVARFPKHQDSASDTTIVYVWALIDTGGRVRETQPMSWEFNKALTSAARTAVGTWRFEPAMCSGRPVPAWTCLAVPFMRK